MKNRQKVCLPADTRSRTDGRHLHMRRSCTERFTTDCTAYTNNTLRHTLQWAYGRGSTHDSDVISMSRSPNARTYPTPVPVPDISHIPATQKQAPCECTPCLAPTQIDTNSAKCGEAACSNVTRSGRRLKLRAVWGVRRAEDWLRGMDGELMASYMGLENWL